MSKQGGLGDNMYVAGRNLSGDTNSIGPLRGGPAAEEVTGIDKSAIERIGGERDGEIGWVAYLNDTAGQAHPTLSALPTADVPVTYFRGTTLGNPAASIMAKQVNYDPTRAQDGSLRFAVQALANGYGTDWGRSLTAGVRSDSAGTNGTGVDFATVSTAFGWQAFLHVFSLTGTNIVVTIQDSADNASFANLASGAFTSVTSVPGYQRLEGGRTDTVRRYLRVVSSGTFSAATFAVQFTRNETAVAF